METGIPNWHTDNAWFDGWDDVLSETENTLLWAEENLRTPRITGVVGEALSLPEALRQYPKSPLDAGAYNARSNTFRWLY